MRRLNLLGLPVDDVTYAESAAYASTLISAEGPARIVTPNPEFVILAQRSTAFREALWQSDLAIPDGGGLLLASRLLGLRLREQVRGTDLAYELVRRARKEGWRVFLLGAGPGVAADAAARLRSLNPGVSIVGAYGGISAKAGDPDTRAAVNGAGRVDLLLVAYGAPAQELWMARNLDTLDVGVAMGVGGVLDYMAGRVRRAPPMIRAAGLEWLFRLVMQPWRWRRQVSLVVFSRLVLAAAIARKRRASRHLHHEESAGGRTAREPPA
ncbi:MAG: acetylglucosaminyldiphospho-UDP acetyl-beta-D-mannosaminyltransferase [Dehalococcoidia bacterium]|nr:acetylglucosaminyldiphospho-UDP acetyl-beta-D-mannosaminyltransferase [Dehalococcoidia bacterium]